MGDWVLHTVRLPVLILSSEYKYAIKVVLVSIDDKDQKNKREDTLVSKNMGLRRPLLMLSEVFR